MSRRYETMKRNHSAKKSRPCSDNSFLQQPVCSLLKKNQRRGARRIGERTRTEPVRRGETIERNEAYEAFSAGC
jgi:hypothetical protein